MLPASSDKHSLKIQVRALLRELSMLRGARTPLGYYGNNEIDKESIDERYLFQGSDSLGMLYGDQLTEFTSLEDLHEQNMTLRKLASELAVQLEELQKGMFES